MICVGAYYESEIELELTAEELWCPIYTLGLPRMGKSVLLGNLALEFVSSGDGVLVIDVKDGTLAGDLAMRADPTNLMYVRLGRNLIDDRQFHWGLNPLELIDRQRITIEELVANTLAMFERLAEGDMEVMQQMRRYLNLAIRSTLYDSDPNMVKVRMILTDRIYRLAFVDRFRKVMNRELVAEWERFDSKDNPASARSQQISSTMNRLFNLLAPESLKYLLVNKTSIHLSEWLEEGKLVVVDAATDINWSQREYYASLVLSQAMNFLFSRRYRPGMRTIRLVCDEFHRYAGANFSEMLEQGQFSGVFPVMSHQNLSQLYVTPGKENSVSNAVTGVPIAFRLRMTAADISASRDLIDPREIELIQGLGKYEAVLSMHEGVPGLLDPDTFCKIKLNDWLVEADPQKLVNAIASQRPYLTPESVLREKIEGYEVPRPTSQSNRNTRSHQSVPEDDDGPDRPTFVRGTARSRRRTAEEP